LSTVLSDPLQLDIQQEANQIPSSLPSRKQSVRSPAKRPGPRKVGSNDSIVISNGARPKLKQSTTHLPLMTIAPRNAPKSRGHMPQNKSSELRYISPLIQTRTEEHTDETQELSGRSRQDSGVGHSVDSKQKMVTSTAYNSKQPTDLDTYRKTAASQRKSDDGSILDLQYMVDDWPLINHAGAVKHFSFCQPEVRTSKQLGHISSLRRTNTDASPMKVGQVVPVLLDDPLHWGLSPPPPPPKNTIRRTTGASQKSPKSFSSIGNEPMRSVVEENRPSSMQLRDAIRHRPSSHRTRPSSRQTKPISPFSPLDLKELPPAPPKGRTQRERRRKTIKKRMGKDFKPSSAETNDSSNVRSRQSQKQPRRWKLLRILKSIFRR